MSAIFDWWILFRNCGQVFCYKCADNFYPLPNFNLTAPVRICEMCKVSVEKQILLRSSNFTNEKQTETAFLNQTSTFRQKFSMASNNSSCSNLTSSDKTNKITFYNNNNNNNNGTNYASNSNTPLYGSPNASAFNKIPNPSFENISSNNSQTRSNSIQFSNSNGPSCSLNVSNRCNNQLDSNKFKTNANKTQKVSAWKYFFVLLGWKVSYLDSFCSCCWLSCCRFKYNNNIFLIKIILNFKFNYKNE